VTLTTITCVWNRPDALQVWLKAIRAAAHPEVNHLIFFVGEKAPPGLLAEGLWVVEVSGVEQSIGHWHNCGASMATSDWIMKLDVDTLPNPRYFEELLPILDFAKPREWFNGGMLYLNRGSSLALEKSGFDENVYRIITDNPQAHCSSFLRPAGTNFICRRKEYLELGGCDERFRGYGWEDYQQIYMLEKHQLGGSPLLGPVDLNNVTWRCRDEISRRKAWELFQRNKWLCLLHRWHSTIGGGSYRAHMNENRKILLEHVCQK
jgi:Glycosyltransferase like family 2